MIQARRVALALLLLFPVAAGADGRALTPERLTDLARQWVVERFGSELAGATLEPVAPPRELPLPPGEVATRLSLQAGSPVTGQLTVLVEAVVTDAHGGRTTRSGVVTLALQVQQDVVVAVRELPRGTIIAAGDVRRERRSGDRVLRGPVAELADAVGKEALRALAPGEPILAASIGPARAVRRGAVVTIMIEGPGFRIAARGVASEDGAVGQTIKVVNQSSRRELAGKVEDERTVRVSF